MNYEDWEKENREQSFKLEDGSNFLGSERLPAKIVVKIKWDKDDDKANKRTFSRTIEERSKP
jgi:hypothetical protein